jgi:hypothetical protein
MGRMGKITPKPKWRNRQTRTTQNRVPSGNVGSIPTFGTTHYTLQLSGQTSSHLGRMFVTECPAHV